MLRRAQDDRRLDLFAGSFLASDSWRLATATDDDSGTPLIYRIRLAPPVFASNESFPHLLVVQWKYESPNDQGMPSEDVAARMLQLEDLLAPAFEGARQAFISVVVTGNGIREWQCYARDREDCDGARKRHWENWSCFPSSLSRTRSRVGSLQPLPRCPRQRYLTRRCNGPAPGRKGTSLIANHTRRD